MNTRDREALSFFSIVCVGMVLGAVMLTACGDDNQTTNNSQAAGGDISGNQSIDASKDDEKSSGPSQSECDACIGNPNDGVTDSVCLADLGC